MAYVFPTCVAVVRWEGGRVHLNTDQQWPADDPFVKAHPALFAEDPQSPQRTAPVVERATQAPGERRQTRKPARKDGPAGE
ncbi:hypothetical protein C1I98_06170 [Spongiactinospora gelatinilytica]|uniref:Uncharacterized protein n=1 Tax=Spongiactinospora gelatinilytica TaxID=2666298 RepID=A0A2W2HRD3_9ACTN|nr:hypothetical protein [Spongiactinospora gelatinilytica]PZG53140.1 hypothetical protein C1I98_06170 [Spongiactinospora gelatinilytica]